MFSKEKRMTAMKKMILFLLIAVMALAAPVSAYAAEASLNPDGQNDIDVYAKGTLSLPGNMHLSQITGGKAAFTAASGTSVVLTFAGKNYDGYSAYLIELTKADKGAYSWLSGIIGGGEFTAYYLVFKNGDGNTVIIKEPYTVTVTKPQGYVDVAVYTVNAAGNKNTASVTAQGGKLVFDLSKGNYFAIARVSYPVKKGRTYTVSGYRYKVTSITNSKKEVTFIGLTAAKRKTATALNIKKTVKIKGITMKITAVGKNALKGNKKVRKVKIGNNVRTIGYGAFSRCTALKNVTIGTGLQTMKGHVFCHDTKLKTITIKSTKLKRVNGTHVFVKVKATIKVPASRVSAYRKLLRGKRGNIKVTK